MQKSKLIYALLLFFVLSACATADVKTDSSGTNQQAADFSLPDQNGKLWTLSDTLKDHSAVVLAFYPKDDTGD